MNWPDPGTPADGEHVSSEPATDAPLDEDGDDHAAGDDAGRRWYDLQDPPTYAQLRSEAAADLGRWQESGTPPTASDGEDAGAGTPRDDVEAVAGAPVPARPDAGQPSDGLRWAEASGAPELERNDGVPSGAGRPADSDHELASHLVSSDEASGVGAEAAHGAPDGDPERTGRTDDDPFSDVRSSDEGAGITRPAYSPHTGSWEAASAPSGGFATGTEPRHDGGAEAPERGHAEGQHESSAPLAPGGFAASVDTDPPAFHGERPATDDRPDALAGAAFHGEHDEAAGPSGDAGRSGETATTDTAAPAVSPSAAAIEDALAELQAGDRQATVICVANQKGGVGKTTTAVSLGAALAMEGAQVLVVDLDPQGNATTGLGLRAQEGAPSTYRVIVEQMDVEDAAEPTAVKGLHVLPSSLDLAGAEIELVPAFSRESRLKQALDAVRDLYDVILIDCPPSLGLLTINALVAADQVLVPIQCEYYALEGLGQLMRTVRLVADSLNRDLAVGGVVLTMFDGRTNLSQQVVDEVRNYFGDVAYQTIVPRTVRLSEAPSYGQPIGVFDAASRGARAYQRLAREVARRLGLELEDEDASPLDRLLASSRPAAPEEASPLPTDLAPTDVPAASETSEAGDTNEGPAAADAGDHEVHGEHAFHGEHDQHDQHPHDEGHDPSGEHGHYAAHQDHGQHDDHGEHHDHGGHEDHGQHHDEGEHHAHPEHHAHGEHDRGPAEHGNHDHAQHEHQGEHGSHDGGHHEGHHDGHHDGGHHEGHHDDGHHEGHHHDGSWQ